MSVENSQSQGRYTFREAMSPDPLFNLQERAMLAIGPVTGGVTAVAGAYLEWINQLVNDKRLNIESIMVHGAVEGLGMGVLLSAMMTGIVANHRGWLMRRDSGFRESDAFRRFHPHKDK